MYLIPNYTNVPERFLPDNALLLVNKFFQMVEQNSNGIFEPLKIQKVKENIYKNIKKTEIKNVVNSNLSILNKKMQFFSTKYQLLTATHLIVGLGATSVLETSIKLHHIYGVPYIPSPAIKGCLRAYKMWELSEWNLELFKAFELAISLVYEKYKSPNEKFSEKLLKLTKEQLKPDQTILIEKRDEIIKKQDELFNLITIFGSKLNKGSLIVFDGYPENFEGFDIDIMNPHYSDYYQGNEYPADWQNLVPIKFITIPGGTKFNFYFLNPYKQLEKDIKNAFKIFGIGAKTSLGYGVFKI